ncbi:MAG: inositol monophosphatase [Chloroflexi bacterium]|nr:MAG: inositol monophosphatase [Chloroflexota bacterium]
MSDAWAAELEFAVGVARRAGTLLTESYERVQRIDYKSARDVVTDVDFRSEALILEAIRDQYPADGILAEESGRHRGSAGGRSDRTWVIDPLDGTVNYANGIPYYCVSIGLAVGDSVALGVILDPARGDLFAATADGPACLNGAATHASDKESLSDYVVSLTVIGRGGIEKERRVAREVRIPRRMGSAALSLAYVAAGRFDAFVQNGGLSLWDVAAAGLIAERAGARVTDLGGGPWWNSGRRAATISTVAAPEPLHRRLIELLAGARVTSQDR